MLNIITDPNFWLLVALYWVFLAVVGGMPDPAPDASWKYVWAHKTLHLLAGNVKNAFKDKIPGGSI